MEAKEKEEAKKSKKKYAKLTLVAECTQMFDSELQDLRFLEFSAVRVSRGRRDQSAQLAEGRVDPVATLFLDHTSPAFPRRVLTGVSSR